jgi:hypothetical protein
MGMSITPEVIKNVELSITIFNWAVLGSFVIALLIGFIRGMKKSIFRFLTRIVPLITLLLFIDLFAKMVLTWQFPGFINIELGNSVLDIVSNYVAKEFNNGVSLDQTSEMYQLVLSLGISVSRFIVFYIGVAICTFIVTPLLNFILFIIRKIFERPSYGPDGRVEKPKKNILSRLIGMGLGGLQYVLVFLIITLPLFGSVSLLMDLKEEMMDSFDTTLVNQTSEVLVNENEQNKEQLENAFKVLEQFDRITIRSILNRFGSKDKPLDALYFGYLTRVKTKQGTINFVYLIDDVKTTLNVLNQYRKDGEIDISELIINEKEALFDLIIKHDFLPMFAPALIEYLDANDLLDENDIDIEALKQIDWEKENEAIALILNKIANLLEVGEFDFDDLAKSLTIPALDDAMEELGKAIAKSELISQLGASFLYEELSKALTEFGTEEGVDVTVLIELADLRNMSEDDWGKNFKTISNIVRAAYELGLFEESDQIDFTKEDALRRLITKPFELTKVQGKEADLLNLLIKFTNMKETFDEWGVSQDFSQIDWNTEPNNLARMLIALTRLGSIEDFSLELIYDALETQEGKDKLSELFEAINASALLQPALRTVVESLINEIDDSLDLSSIDFDAIDWVVEFEAIKEIKEQVEALEDGIELLTGETIEQLMINAAKGDITTLMVGKMINKSLEEMFQEHNPKVDGKLVFDYTDKDILAGNADDMRDLIDFANAMKEAYSDPDLFSPDKKIALGEAIQKFEKVGEERPTPIDYYLPAILNYAQVPGSSITTEGLVSSGKTYAYEGQLLVDFFKALNEGDKGTFTVIALDIQTNSYLAKEVFVAWNPLI